MKIQCTHLFSIQDSQLIKAYITIHTFALEFSDPKREGLHPRGFPFTERSATKLLFKNAHGEDSASSGAVRET